MNIHGKDIKIFTANANPSVAAQMARHLGLPLGKSEVRHFSDGEISVNIGESVRGSDRRIPARVRRTHHSSRSLFRLCAPGPQSQGSRADLRKVVRKPDLYSRR